MASSNVSAHNSDTDCHCATCTHLRTARQAIHAALSTFSLGADESAALDMLVAAIKPLSDAQGILQRVHAPKRSDEGLSPQKLRGGGEMPDGFGGGDRHDGNHQVSPEHRRQVTNPWGGGGERVDGEEVMGQRSGQTKGFQETVRARAAELGILRGMDGSSDGVGMGTSPPKSSTWQDSKSPMKENSQFIVCDHCRSHGIRCNEASVCKECILREVPCSHRHCDLSPNSKAECPRQVCFYVHADWMPDMNGAHNPKDPNWIVLPGKLREKFSAGQLGKLPMKDEEEVVRCYEGVEARQRMAVEEMGRCVAIGMGTWETVQMKCACVEIEQEQRVREAQEGVRKMGMHAGGE